VFLIQRPQIAEPQGFIARPTQKAKISGDGDGKSDGRKEQNLSLFSASAEQYLNGIFGGTTSRSLLRRRLGE
jgi:hypothetical protein